MKKKPAKNPGVQWYSRALCRDDETLLDFYLSPILSRNPRLKAFLFVKEREALSNDLKGLKAKDPGKFPLRGVPVALKDVVDVRGMPTTGGALGLRWPEKDAGIVKALTKVGCLIMGKTNMHELAHGITGENPHYGRVPNPLDSRRMAGGSSSGSAAAVAAGMVPLALGSDTAGSIRIPAAFCGIFGIKPSRGFLPVEGCLPLSQSLDHLGFFASSARDLLLLFQALAPESFAGSEAKEIKKVGVPFSFILPLLEEDTERQFSAFLKELAVEVEPVEFPRLEEAPAAASVIVFKEAFENHASRLKKPELLGRDVRVCLEMGREISREDYIRAKDFQNIFGEEMRDLFSLYDCLIMPCTPGPAPLAGTRKIVLRGKPYPLAYPLTCLNYPASLAGLPALTVPWREENRLPTGFQVITREDGDLLAFLGCLEKRKEGESRQSSPM